MSPMRDRWCEEQNIPWFVLGGGSNVVIADRGFDGLVLHIAHDRDDNDA